MSPINASSGFFGGIQSGFSKTEEMHKSHALATERLLKRKFDAQKEEDAVTSRAIDDVRVIQEKIAGAGPEEMEALLPQIEYYKKVLPPELLPEEFLNNTYGDIIDKDEAEAMFPNNPLKAGSLVDPKFKLGDPKAGESKFLKSGPKRALTEEEVDEFQTQRAWNIANAVGKVRNPAKYGSPAAAKKHRFLQFGYAEAVTELAAIGAEGGFKAGLMDDEAFEAVKAGLYARGDAVGAKKDDIEKMAARLDKQRKNMVEHGNTEATQIASDVRLLTDTLNDLFHLEKGLDDAIATLGPGERSLYLGMYQKGMEDIVNKNGNMAEILLGISYAASNRSHTAEKLNELGQAREGAGSYRVANLGGDVGDPRIADQTWPDKVQWLYNNNPNIGYDSGMNAMSFIVPGEPPVIIYGNEEIGRYHDSARGWTDLNKQIMKMEMDEPKSPPEGPVEKKKRETSSNLGSIPEGNLSFDVPVNSELATGLPPEFFGMNKKETSFTDMMFGG